MKGRMVTTADGGEREEASGPVVYPAGRGVWAATIPETALRSIAEQKVENAAVVPTWGVAALARAAKEALDRHDADQRRERWADRCVRDLFAESLGPLSVNGHEMTRVQARDWFRLQYDRAVGTEDR